MSYDIPQTSAAKQKHATALPCNPVSICLVERATGLLCLSQSEPGKLAKCWYQAFMRQSIGAARKMLQQSHLLRRQIFQVSLHDRRRQTHPFGQLRGHSALRDALVVAKVSQFQERHQDRTALAWLIAVELARNVLGEQPSSPSRDPIVTLIQMPVRLGHGTLVKRQQRDANIDRRDSCRVISHAGDDVVRKC